METQSAMQRSTMMNTPPATLGNHLLVAIDDQPASLAMIRLMAQQLPDPAHVNITLLHYLPPTYWEHGGDDSARGEAEVEQEIERALQNEVYGERLTQGYFDQARRLLEKAGVPSGHIREEIDSDANSVADAILSILKGGSYSCIVIGRRHHSFVTRLLGASLADALRARLRHQGNDHVAVWIIDERAG